jgi:hypothetical protein
LPDERVNEREEPIGARGATRTLSEVSIDLRRSAFTLSTTEARVEFRFCTTLPRGDGGDVASGGGVASGASAAALSSEALGTQPERLFDGSSVSESR